MYEIKILELWNSRLLALKRPNGKEDIFNIDGFEVKNYQKEERISIKIYFNDQEGILNIVQVKKDITSLSLKIGDRTLFSNSFEKADEIFNEIIKNIKSWL